MSVADPLSALAAELRTMPPRARRAAIGALTPAERVELERAATEPKAVGIEAGELARLSPWLASRVLEARAAGDDGGMFGTMTSAARRALLHSVRDEGRPIIVTQGRRSLVDVVGGFLSSRRERS